METKALHFQKHYDLAYRAHTGTSFSPEKRAETIIRDYSEQIISDVDSLKQMQADSGTIERYTAKYEALFVSWLASKSNCISPMITGGSNFPVRMAEKANNRESAKYSQFQDYRNSFLKAIEKQERKQAIEDAGGELEIAKKKLIELNFLQQQMKRLNKAHAAFVKNPNSIIDSDLNEEEKEFVIKWFPKYEYIKKPFQTFSLTNNNAKIKNTQARINELEKKEQNKISAPKSEILFEGGRVFIDHIADRIKIENTERPSSEVITSYKKHGLKWSPRGQCWQRQITANAFYSIEKLLNIKF